MNFGHDLCLVPLVHWIHCDYDTCLKIDTCHDRNESNVIGHWTKAIIMNFAWLFDLHDVRGTMHICEA